MKPLHRVYHHYEKLEEFHCGMWGKVSPEHQEEYLKKAIEFTGDAELYGSYMMKAIVEWPSSCEHNLTDRAMNRQAWIGHAACCIGLGYPEDIIRLAWHYLSEQQQDEANAKADEAIAAWEKRYLEIESMQLCLSLV